MAKQPEPTFARDFEKPWRENERLARIDKQYEPETRSMESQIQVSGDTPSAGASKAHSGELTTNAEIQRANPPPTPPGVKREGVGGYIYPKSFEVL